MKKETLSKLSEQFCQALIQEERSTGTIEKYLRDIRAFCVWIEDKELSKEATSKWKEHLLSKGYQPTTINSMLSPLNGFLRFIGRDDCRVRFLRIQRRIFRDPERNLCRDDYNRLLEAAKEMENSAFSSFWKPSAPLGSEFLNCSLLP